MPCCVVPTSLFCLFFFSYDAGYLMHCNNISSSLFCMLGLFTCTRLMNPYHVVMFLIDM